MTFREVLADGPAGGRKLVVTAELSPPGNPVSEPVRRAAALIAGLVDAANVTDNPAATPKVSPVVTSLFEQNWPEVGWLRVVEPD